MERCNERCETKKKSLVTSLIHRFADREFLPSQYDVEYRSEMIVLFILFMCHVLLSSERECSGLWMSQSYREVFSRGKANEV